MNVDKKDYEIDFAAQTTVTIATTDDGTAEFNIPLVVACEWCEPNHYFARFAVQLWVRVSTGKRRWMSVTQEYKKKVQYCPMCGRKLEV